MNWKTLLPSDVTCSESGCVAESHSQAIDVAGGVLVTLQIGRDGTARVWVHGPGHVLLCCVDDLRAPNNWTPIDAPRKDG